MPAPGVSVHNFNEFNTDINDSNDGVNDSVCVK